jgi:hypothetical protein
MGQAVTTTANASFQNFGSRRSIATSTLGVCYGTLADLMRASSNPLAGVLEARREGGLHFIKQGEGAPEVDALDPSHSSRSIRYLVIIEPGP